MLFRSGLYICSEPALDIGIDFKPKVVRLERDRSMVNSFDVKWYAARMIEETKEEPEPLKLSKPDMRRLLAKSGVPEERLESFEEEFEETVGEKNTLLASNIANIKTFQIETPDVIVKVKPERSDLVETREIDGRRCLVIAIDDHLQVNGIEIHK